MSDTPETDAQYWDIQNTATDEVDALAATEPKP